MHFAEEGSFVFKKLPINNQELFALDDNANRTFNQLLGDQQLAGNFPSTGGNFLGALRCAQLLLTQLAKRVEKLLDHRYLLHRELGIIVS